MSDISPYMGDSRGRQTHEEIVETQPPLEPSLAAPGETRTSRRAAPSSTPSRPPTRLSGVLVAAAGLLAASGAVLPWIDVSFDTRTLEGFASQLQGMPTSGGLDAIGYGPIGQAAVALGAVLLVTGVASMLTGAGRRVLGIIAIAAGLGVAALGGYALVTATDHAATQVGVDFDEEIASLDVPAEVEDGITEVRSRLLEAYAISPGIGLWLAVGGGILGVAGGGIAIRSRQGSTDPGSTR